MLLDKRKDQLLAKLRTLAQLTDEYNVAHEILLAFILFLLSLARSDIVKSERTFSFTEMDLVKVLLFKRNPIDKDTKIGNTHPLLVLQQNLLKFQSKTDLLDDIKVQLDEIAFNLKKLLKILDVGLTSIADTNKEFLHADSPMQEPAYPQSESIVAQYSMRSIYNVAPSEFKPTEYPEQLTTNYWYSHLLANRFEEFDGQLPTESVTCDFIEIIKTFLPPETNLTNECKRLLHLSASPQSNRERTTSVSDNYKKY